MAETESIAFALGGLAGNNAHGAGFLQAALKTKNYTPLIISCTSGQLLWTYYYLKARRDPKFDLREIITEEIEKINRTPNINANMALLALWGREDVYRPAYPEYMRELCGNALESFRRVMASGWDTFFLGEFSDCFPGRILVPLFPEKFFDDVSATFIEEDEIGIVFNSYNPIDGMEYVHANNIAKPLISHRYGQGPDPREKRRRNEYRDRTRYRDISRESVKHALWLYYYGFGNMEAGFLDGAYYRQIMLSELTQADKIYVVRPLKYRWVGKLPKSAVGMEDLKTEVGFDGSYAGERNQILLINKLNDEGLLQQGKYKKIRLCEVEVEVQRGYFDYLFEKSDVFDAALDIAQRRFNCTEADCDRCPYQQ